MKADLKPCTITVTAKLPKVKADLGTPVVKEYIEVEAYTGSYTVTPTAEEQILNTGNKRMTENLKINPIPSNYGLITWDGSTITVS